MAERICKNCAHYAESIGCCGVDWTKQSLTPQSTCEKFVTPEGFKSFITGASAGIKYDDGKPRLAEMVLDFSSEMEELCKVWEYGADHYGKSNWKEVANGKDRYLNALYRHSFAADNSPIDEESGLFHAAHMVFNALAYLHFVLKEKDDVK